MRPCFRVLRGMEVGVRNSEAIDDVAMVKERYVRIIKGEHNHQCTGQYLLLSLYH